MSPRRQWAVATLAAADTMRSKPSGRDRSPLHVEHQGEPALPGLLVVADDQVVGAGAHGPVHPAEVVADHVGPQGVELLARPAGAGAAVLAGEGLGARGPAQRRDPVDAGQHEQPHPPGEGPAPASQPEGVGDLGDERADRHLAAVVGGEAVGGPHRAAGQEGRHHQAGAGPIADRVAEGEHRGGPPPRGGDLDLDPGPRARRAPGAGGRAADRQAGPQRAGPAGGPGRRPGRRPRPARRSSTRPSRRAASGHADGRRRGGGARPGWGGALGSPAGAGRGRRRHRRQQVVDHP